MQVMGPIELNSPMDLNKIVRVSEIAAQQLLDLIDYKRSTKTAISRAEIEELVRRILLKADDL